MRSELYVIDSGITDGGPAHIRVFDVDVAAGKVSNGKVFAEGFAPGITDGMRCDVEGNVWCSMGWADPKEDGVRCYSPEGDLLGKIHIPETVANLTFGGLLAQPALHLRQHVALCVLRGYAGSDAAVTIRLARLRERQARSAGVGRATAHAPSPAALRAATSPAGGRGIRIDID